MASKNDAQKGQYGEVVSRLQTIVEALEAGELTLEDSLDRFAEGVQLVKQGERLLADAEKRIEQLLTEDGRTAPLKIADAAESAAPAPASTLATPMATKAVRRVTTAPAASTPADDGDDVPF